AYGTVSNFVAPTNFDVTTLANANASILGQSGTTVVLAAFQGTNATQTRIVTQNFKVGGGADPNALAQRYTLFLDAVCWLVRCQACSDVGLGLGSSVTPNPAALGQAVTYQWVVGNNGRCEGTGTVLTSLLPAGAQFVSAEAQFGTWEYNTNLGAVIFQIGLLPQGPTRVSFTVIPWQPGTLTNTTEVSANAVPPNTNQVVTVVIGLELNLEWTGGTNYLLQLFGNEGLNYEIQTSTNLPQWTDWTNVPGPAWATPLTDPLHTNFPWRFYRALSQ
ncbi:MAG TPA: hypothetical protein VN765_01555, partial [Candidatus Acidoferrum sp.]|nr:hypothetical protein [Candidatus Acidoferrum sp.]